MISRANKTAFRNVYSILNQKDESGGFSFSAAAATTQMGMAGEMHQFATVTGGAQFVAFEQGAIAAHKVELIKALGPASFDGINEMKVLLAIHG